MSISDVLRVVLGLVMEVERSVGRGESVSDSRAVLRVMMGVEVERVRRARKMVRVVRRRRVGAECILIVLL